MKKVIISHYELNGKYLINHRTKMIYELEDDEVDKIINKLKMIK